MSEPKTPAPALSSRAPISSPGRNIEIKARLKSLDAARQVARRLATAELGAQIQTDTYFACRNGRLKLREIALAEAQLIAYERRDGRLPRASDYQIASVSNPADLKEVLRVACGIVAVVKKRREIFLFKNVRIHLDQVEGKGVFLEFEAVLGEHDSDEAGQRLVEALLKQFGLCSSDLLPSSYAEMP